jgi:hypothetical protein
MCSRLILPRNSAWRFFRVEVVEGISERLSAANVQDALGTFHAERAKGVTLKFTCK